MAGDLGRFTQFETAEAIPAAAANPSGEGGMGVGLGAAVAMGQAMMGSMQGAMRTSTAASPGAGARFCPDCGRQLPVDAKFCPACGKAQ